MSEPAKYSISRAIADVIEAGVPRNKAESEFHFEAVRSSEKSGLSKMLGWPGRGFIAPLRGLSTRQATSGPWTQEKAVAEGLGVIGWSAVVRAGATILGPLRANLGIWHTSDLPVSEWLPETGNLTPSDPTILASMLSPKRIAAQTIFSRQLFIQASVAVDQYVTREIARALSSRLDAACLYGRGNAFSEPLGVLATANVNSVPFPPPAPNAAWLGLNAMRLACLDHDVFPDSYGLISSPRNESELLLSAPATATAPTVWHSIPDPKYFSRQIDDNRFFSGCWAYLAIGLFGGTGDEAGLDIVIDPVTLARNGQVIVTVNLWCDCAVRWPQVFAFSQVDPLPFGVNADSTQKKKAA